MLQVLQTRYRVPILRIGDRVPRLQTISTTVIPALRRGYLDELCTDVELQEWGLLQAVRLVLTFVQRAARYPRRSAGMTELVQRFVARLCWESDEHAWLGIATIRG